MHSENSPHDQQKWLDPQPPLKENKLSAESSQMLEFQSVTSHNLKLVKWCYLQCYFLIISPQPSYWTNKTNRSQGFTMTSTLTDPKDIFLMLIYFNLWTASELLPLSLNPPFPWILKYDNPLILLLPFFSLYRLILLYSLIGVLEGSPSFLPASH